MRRWLAAVVAGLSLLGLAGGAAAVVYGSPDNGLHPEAGALLALTPYSDGTLAACSGVLISSTVFVTAAHCGIVGETVTTGGSATVSFENAWAPFTYPATSYTGTWHADPLYRKSQGDPNDVGVVVFSSPIGIAHALLPTANQLDKLPKNQQFTTVGYGAQLVTNGPGGKTYHYADTRYFGAGTLNSVTQAWLKLSGNPSHGDAGTCYGDSGGPNFLGAGAGETTTVAALTNTGDQVCRATNVDYRLDTAAARSFLGQYVPLP